MGNLAAPFQAALDFWYRAIVGAAFPKSNSLVERHWRPRFRRRGIPMPAIIVDLRPLKR